MRARELAQDLPVVRVDDDALRAARLIAEQRLPGVAVVDRAGHPVAVLPASQVVRFVVPGYVQEDPSLARVFDEGSADACARSLRGKRVGDLLPAPERRVELAVVRGSANVMECAATMARLRSPLLIVADGDVVHGLLTASHVLEMLLPSVGNPDPGPPGPR